MLLESLISDYQWQYQKLWLHYCLLHHLGYSLLNHLGYCLLGCCLSLHLLLHLGCCLSLHLWCCPLLFQYSSYVYLVGRQYYNCANYCIPPCELQQYWSFWLWACTIYTLNMGLLWINIQTWAVTIPENENKLSCLVLVPVCISILTLNLLYTCWG